MLDLDKSCIILPQSNQGKTACTIPQGAHDMSKLSSLLGHFQCWIGFHNFRVINKTLGFGAAGSVEKVQCRRCGMTMTREA